MVDYFFILRGFMHRRSWRIIIAKKQLSSYVVLRDAGKSLEGHSVQIFGSKLTTISLVWYNVCTPLTIKGVFHEIQCSSCPSSVLGLRSPGSHIRPRRVRFHRSWIHRTLLRGTVDYAGLIVGLLYFPKI